MPARTIQTHISALRTFPTKDKPLHVQCRELFSDFFPHDHDFIETVLVVEGEGYHCTRHGERPLAAGDLIVIAPGAWHAYRVPQRLVVFNCCFGLSMLARELAAVYQNGTLRRLFTASGGPLDFESVIVARIGRQAFRRSLCCLRRMETIQWSGIIESHYLEQIGRLLLYLGEIAPFLAQTAASPERTPGSVHPAVVHCRALLEERYDEEWTLTKLADEIHIAPKYLVRLFQESAGMAPMAYLARTRGERASLLLVNTDLPVSEIGSRVGWPDPNYFARRFRSLLGMSATEYRGRFARQVGLSPVITVPVSEADSNHGLTGYTTPNRPDSTATHSSR